MWHKVPQFVLHDCFEALVLIAALLLQYGALHLTGKEIAYKKTINVKLAFFREESNNLLTLMTGQLNPWILLPFIRLNEG